MGSARKYILDIAIQPPAVARARTPLYPPLAIRVHMYDANGYEISGEDELSGLFAHAALYRESGDSPSLAPPDMYLLSGRLSMSLHLLNDPGDGSLLDQQQGSYVLFPDLTINRPGRYRLGVSLFKVDGGVGIRSQATVANGGAGGGTTLEEAKTDVIFVQEGVESTPIGAAAQNFLEHLKSRGADVPSPP